MKQPWPTGSHYPDIWPEECKRSAEESIKITCFWVN